MRKIILITIALALLTGFAIADPGINETPESQGMTTATTIDAIGNYASTTDIQWLITDDNSGLNNLLPLDPHSVHYASTYAEDTFSNGMGLIAYDKNLDIETSEQLSGQWNIDADKQLEFVGVDGARVYSDEYIMVDGVGNYTHPVEDKMLCVFAGGEILVPIIHLGDTGYTYWPHIFPANCNFAEAGSTIDMTMANVRTNSMDRFITPSTDTSVELEHDLLVTELIDGVPSSGTGSAFMNVLIMEARGIIALYDDPESLSATAISPLMERIEFNEVTTVTGDITVFDKVMNYNSEYTGAGELNKIIITYDV
jgi:hypothetical protein